MCQDILAPVLYWRRGEEGLEPFEVKYMRRQVAGKKGLKLASRFERMR